jgi:hypothetical protein
MSSTLHVRDSHSGVIARSTCIEQGDEPTTSRRNITRTTLAAAVIFLAAFLFLNRDLFHRPVYDWADYAANALQIQNAKHFHELVGNYSRWGFHHPGPAFFYVFAGGELLFHDWLHLVPEALNAHVLTIILVNTAFLFGTIWIFARQTSSPIFAPLGLLSALAFCTVVSHTLRLIDNGGPCIRPTALTSIWMPHVILFCFLFYVTTSAVVACGDLRYLPLAVLAGLMLLHAHVAQLLFVTVLAAFTLGTFVYRSWRDRTLAGKLRRHRRSILVSAALVVIFAAPPVIEILVHTPNNLDAIRSYMHDSPHVSNSLAKSSLYELSFFTFLANPEIALEQSSPHLFARALHTAYAVKYWAFIAVLLAALVWTAVRRRLQVSPFVRYVLFELCLVCALFLYWGIKIAGGLENFNGYFIYSMQLLALFAILSIVIGSWKDRIAESSKLPLLLSCAIPLLIFGAPRDFRAVIFGPQDINQIASAAAGRAPMIQIVFGHDDWPTAVGVASRLHRVNQPFCVAPWLLMFGRDATCHDLSHTLRLVLTHNSASCVAPCQVLLQAGQITAELSPYPKLQLPFTLKTDQASALFDGFYTDGPEGSPMWATEQASIRFLMGAPDEDNAKLRVTIVGMVRPNMPVEVRLNGNVVGAMKYGDPRVASFVLPNDWLKSGSENTLTFSVPNAGPAGPDPRHLGYWLESVSFDKAGS